MSDTQTEFYSELYKIEIKGGGAMAEDEKRKKVVYAGELLDSIDKDRSAIALEYETGDIAPKVIASGKGYVAEKILEKATEYDIPVHKDEKLAKSLEQIEIGEYIPQELYQVVAEVLVYVDAMDKVKGKVMDQNIENSIARRKRQNGD